MPPFTTILLTTLVVVLGCASLLNVVVVQTMLGWKLTVLTTEFGHWLAPIAVLAGGIAAWRCESSGARVAVAIVAVLAVGLFSVPVFQAQAVARAHRVGFSWSALWFGRPAERVPVITREFARSDGWALSLDFYQPVRAANAGPAPCIVVIHGGGWDSGDRGQLPELNRVLAHRGFAVAAISYRLVPQWRWPAPREDTFAALRWLRTHAAELGIDAERLVLLGRSAGGQIAMSAGYEPEARMLGVCGVISFYGPADQRFAYSYGKEDDLLRSPALMRAYFGGSPETAPAAYDTASPYFVARKSAPPTLLLHGARDALVWHRQSERLTARLRERGGDVEFVSFPWATHAFDFNLRGPAGQISTAEVLRFVERITSDQP